MIKSIAVITPVRHLPGVVDLLETKGEVFLLENGTKQEVRSLLLQRNIDTILCNPNKQGFKLDEELLKHTNVSLINTCSTGMNHIDSLYCSYKGIKILSLTKDYELIRQLPSTAELAFGLLLDLLRNITKSNSCVKETKTWDYTPFIGRQIKDLKIGIVGCGRLGSMMKKYCEAFDAKVFVFDPYSSHSNVETIDQLFETCDAVSLHIHVTDETKGLVNYDLLSKNVKFLINTSRGEIVVEKDVVKALKEEKLLGYGTDVLVDEFTDIKKSVFLKPENSYLNTIITPHVGGMTVEGQTKAYLWAISKF